MENSLDHESKRFTDDARQAIDFATEILKQLPQTDRRREILSEQLNEYIVEIVQGFNDDCGLLFDPDSAQDESFGQAVAVLTADGMLQEQMRVIRGYYTGRCWQTVISVLTCLLDDDQRYELGEVTNSKQYMAFYDQYQQIIKNARETHSKNLQNVKMAIIHQQKLADQAQFVNEQLMQYQQQKKQKAEQMDKVSAEIATKCDEISLAITELQKDVSSKQMEATQSAYRCKILIKPKPKNEKLLSLQQTTVQIDEIWQQKQKHDLTLQKLKKPAESIRQFVHTFFVQKFGQLAQKQKAIQQFVYSVGFWAQEDNICAIFYAELQLEIDEIFKHNVLKIEQKIDECQKENVAVLRLIYKDENVIQLLHKQAGEDRQKLKNVVNLYELEQHKLHLKQYCQIWQKIDIKRIGRLSCQEFELLVKEYGIQQSEQVVFEASRGGQVVTFTQGMVALSEFIFE